MAIVPGWGELLLAGVVGLLLFGGRLPEVAKDVGRAFFRFRRTMTGLRRETGIDRTLRDLRLEIEREDSGLPEPPPILDADGAVSREEPATLPEDTASPEDSTSPKEAGGAEET